MAVERDLIRKFFLEANPRVDRTDCPEEATLKALAENRLPATHPARLHLESCSPCFAEFRGYKLEAKDRQRRQWLWSGAVAACFLLAFIFWRSPLIRKTPTAAVNNAARPVEQAEVTREIDLSKYVTTRGGDSDAVPLDAVALPTAVVHLIIRLPRLSEPGHYDVAVSSDRTGQKILSQGKGIATGTDPKTTLSVTLDLRKAPPGSYFLSTEREQEGGAYYYPLRLQ